VLPIVHARQPLGGSEIEDAERLSAQCIDEPTLFDINPARGGLPDRYRDDASGMRAPELGANIAADRVVDADDRGAISILPGEDPTLGGDIPVHVAMPVEMVGGDVE